MLHSSQGFVLSKEDRVLCLFLGPVSISFWYGISYDVCNVLIVFFGVEARSRLTASLLRKLDIFEVLLYFRILFAVVFADVKAQLRKERLNIVIVM